MNSCPKVVRIRMRMIGYTSNIQDTAKETGEKASEIMKIYLGYEPDSSEAIEFLYLAEGDEVVHYEVLSTMAKNIKNRQFSAKVKSILEEEQKHLINSALGWLNILHSRRYGIVCIILKYKFIQLGKSQYIFELCKK